MGSQAIQSKLWGQRSKDWAEIQEATGQAGYNFVLHHLSVSSDTKLLDVGCGTGYFCHQASVKGIKNITGLDATPEFIEEAKKRLSAASFMVGEMEALPFKEETFDVVCGFNSFQYAADTKHALTEAKRVLKKGGVLVTMIWGNEKDCEAATYLKAVSSLLPPPPSGSGGPFALSENNRLQKILAEAGLSGTRTTDVASLWDYPNEEIALRGLMSAGPVAKAIEQAGFIKTYEVISIAVRPYLQPDGHVVYHNQWRIALSQK